MSKNHRWLRNEIGDWQRQGLIDAALAERLLARYPLAADRGWGRLIFSALGAVLVGLGVILFFAYNWSEIPKAAKLILVFAALLGAHGGAVLAARQPQPHAGLVEGLHVLGTMLFGAGIWLVAQIYHIDEHYPNAFLVWSLGALALAWALPSIAQGMLAMFLVSFWAGVEFFDFHAPVPAAPALVGLGALPLAWWRRSPALMFVALSVLFVVTGFAVGVASTHALLPVLFLLAAAAVLAGHVAAGPALDGVQGPLRTLGLLVTCGCLYVLSFPRAAGLLGRIDFAKPGVAVYLGTAAVALAAALFMLVRGGLARRDRWQRWQLALLGGVTIAAGAALLPGPLSGWPLAGPFNALALGMAALLIGEGSAGQRPWRVGAGCVLFSLIAVSRYVDLFNSLLERAAVFVALGAGLFAVGNFYARQKRRVREGAS